MCERASLRSSWYTSGKSSAVARWSPRLMASSNWVTSDMAFMIRRRPANCYNEGAIETLDWEGPAGAPVQTGVVRQSAHDWSARIEFSPEDILWRRIGHAQAIATVEAINAKAEPLGSGTALSDPPGAGRAPALLAR